jgi:hypothetical protein
MPANASKIADQNKPFLFARVIANAVKQSYPITVIISKFYEIVHDSYF